VDHQFAVGRQANFVQRVGCFLDDDALAPAQDVQQLGLPGLEQSAIPFQLLALGTELEFVIMVIAVSCVKLLSAHNSTQHTSRKHKV
jgi:hypothetical protein